MAIVLAPQGLFFLTASRLSGPLRTLAGGQAPEERELLLPGGL